MKDILVFENRAAFRNWLEENHPSQDGVWLLFGKAGGPKTLKASEALEEALCFGWIDGLMKSIDEKRYQKYFAQRRPGSKWSDKNKKLVAMLEKQGVMTDHGRAKIQEAKQNGQWDAPDPMVVTAAQIAAVSDLLQDHTAAHANFLAMSPSVQKTYTRAYYDAKTDAGRASRLAWMIDRLNKNLKPM